MRARVVALVAALALGALPARAQQADCGTPAKIDDGWTLAKPEDAGLDRARLCGIAERLKATNANVHGVVIVRGGKLVFEQYFVGHDMPWGGDHKQYEFDATTLHDMRSVTKSVVSLLLGIALDRKLIASLDEPVMNGGGTDLLGKVIEKASGQPIDAFARQALFEPLGITDWKLMNYVNGKQATAAGLRLRPRDAAKIGQLVLSNGQWNGRQVVSAEWIADSTKPHFQAINMLGGAYFYGYQWWLGRTLAGDRQIQWVAGVGLGGQRLYIVPDLDLVVMVTQGLYTSGRQGQAGLDILANFVVPAARNAAAR
jgi:CubicO group peptidase (beta-lactamase class C family)